MINLTQRFLMSMLTGVGAISFKILISVVLIPILIHSLGVDTYGLYVLIIGLLDLSWIMDFGFSYGIVKIVGSYRSTQEQEKGDEILHAGNWLYLGLAVLFCLTGFFLLPFLGQAYHLSPAQHALFNSCFPLILGEGTITTYSAYYRSVLKSHCLDQWNNVGDTMSAILSNSLGIVLILLGYGLPALLLTRLICALGRLILLMGQTRRVEKQVLTLRLPIQFKCIRELFTISCHAMMTNFCVLISHRLDNNVIAFFLPLSNVGVFDLVFKLIDVPTQIGMKICDGLFPIFTRLAALSQSEKARLVFLKISSLNNFVVSLLLLVIIMNYPVLLAFLSHHKISVRESWPILMVAAPIAWTGVITMPATAYLFFSGRQHYVTTSSIIAALSNITLSIFFIHIFGLVGVALGTLIPQGIQHQFGLVRTARRDLNISFLEYAKTVYLPVVLPLLFAGLSCCLLKPVSSWGPHPIISLSVVTMFVIIISSLLWCLLSTTLEEREMILSKALYFIRPRSSTIEKAS